MTPRNAMIPEPLMIVPDAEGHPQWLPGWDLPKRTIIDRHSIAYFGWVVIDGSSVRIMFDDKPVIYQRIAYGIHGEWICDLQWNPVPLAEVKGDEQAIAS